MHKLNAALAVMISLAVAIPSAACAQLSSVERSRAEQRARIQAKADAEERDKERRISRDSAQSACRSSGRVWDYANNNCKPNPLIRRPKDCAE